MPVFRLNSELIFPHPSLANEQGLLAIGGDLTDKRLLLAYYNGIFPWFSKGEPILWWSPDPRFVLKPEDIRASKSMRKIMKKGVFHIKYDTAFRDVIVSCSDRPEDGTWITDEMVDAYCRLHQQGYAHSVETWHDGKLVGGLYGVSLGKCFFGESMFSREDNASKAALIDLAGNLVAKGFVMIDCQVYSKHLESLGAVNVPRGEFLTQLKKGLSYDTICGDWGKVFSNNKIDENFS